ncbi:hypothetical protein HBB16_20120 [Pseudonocardia sp. MCCB 268]|nr:hypothetical protein [Pseudonocardia cytotoxica]
MTIPPAVTTQRDAIHVESSRTTGARVVTTGTGPDGRSTVVSDGPTTTPRRRPPSPWPMSGASRPHVPPRVDADNRSTAASTRTTRSRGAGPHGQLPPDGRWQASGGYGDAMASIGSAGSHDADAEVAGMRPPASMSSPSSGELHAVLETGEVLLRQELAGAAGHQARLEQPHRPAGHHRRDHGRRAPPGTGGTERRRVHNPAAAPRPQQHPGRIATVDGDRVHRRRTRRPGRPQPGRWPARLGVAGDRVAMYALNSDRLQVPHGRAVGRRRAGPGERTR